MFKPLSESFPVSRQENVAPLLPLKTKGVKAGVVAGRGADWEKSEPAAWGQEEKTRS